LCFGIEVYIKTSAFVYLNIKWGRLATRKFEEPGQGKIVRAIEEAEGSLTSGYSTLDSPIAYI